MIDISLEEAQLFRMLTALFGGEQVVPQMSVMAVCGGELPSGFNHHSLNVSEAQYRALNMPQWAKKNKCLFTVLDCNDNPKMVVEFFSGFRESVSNTEVEHERYLPPLFEALGIHYVTISPQEFDEITDPSSSLDIVSLLNSRVAGEEKRRAIS